MYTYQADIWCESCGRRIMEDLEREHPDEIPADPSDLYSFDSDEYPKPAVPGEIDYPGHCAAGAECIEALDLRPYGAREDALVGAETVSIGALIEDQLTDHGAEYLRELLSESDPTPYQAALHKFWRAAFADYL
jgi:hypothetical protein